MNTDKSNNKTRAAEQKTQVYDNFATARLVKKVIETIEEEERALRITSRSLCQTQIANFLSVILNNQGTLFVTGVGKSGSIGQKSVATLNSIGYRATYLHPTDAAHGDIGAIRQTDVVLLISKSGESDELISLLPHLRSRLSPLLLLTSCHNSTLAKSIDTKIVLPQLPEACPLNLAPTVSTTVTLAILDGIAMAVMTHLNLRPEIFATNHPAGQLGKRLTITIDSIMHKGQANPTAHASAPFLTIVQLLTENPLGAVNIIDETENHIGLVTDGDVRRAIKKFAQHGAMRLDQIYATDIMSTSPTYTTKDCLAYLALQLMQNRDRPLSVLPVVDGQTKKCVGLVRLHDMIKYGLA